MTGCFAEFWSDAELRQSPGSWMLDTRDCFAFAYMGIRHHFNDAINRRDARVRWSKYRKPFGGISLDKYLRQSGDHLGLLFRSRKLIGDECFAIECVAERGPEFRFQSSHGNPTLVSRLVYVVA